MSIRHTKDEILQEKYLEDIKKHGMESICPKRFPAAYESGAIAAMDEYATLEAIAFANWVTEYHPSPCTESTASLWAKFKQP